jgi:hypothetical protein
MRVELVFFTGCPSVPNARRRLSEALTVVGIPPSWQERDMLDPGTPAEYQHYGSPTVLVDGHDIAGDQKAAGMTCVVDGGPSVEVIAQALRSAR